MIYSVDKKTISETDKKAEPTNLEEYLKEPVTGAYSYCKDYNLYVVKDGKETQVTTDGSYEIVYTGKMYIKMNLVLMEKISGALKETI